MRIRIASMTAATLLAVVHLASAQAPCDLPTATIDRLKIEMAETPALPSGQLFVKIGNANAAPFERAQGSQYWTIELWDSAVLKPVPVTALDGIAVTKAGWRFRPYGQSKPRSETIGGSARCAITLAFRGDEEWQVQVVAEPEGVAVRVPVTCAKFCGPQTSRTDFESLRMRKDERFQMKANFIEGCEASVEVAADQLQRRSGGALTLRERDLLLLVPESCVNDYYKIKIVRRRMPDALTFRHVLPRER
jgi:hypothetical protein